VLIKQNEILTTETGTDENFVSPIVLGEETFLSVPVKLLRTDNVVDFGQLLGYPS
jgi:hypothetical protein